MSSNYPHGTVEFIPVTVTIDGELVSNGVEFSVVTGGAEHGTWSAPTAVGGLIGVMTDNQARGTYTVWAKVTDSPEIPIIDCGQYSVV